MEATSTDRKTLMLTDNGQLLGELIYENLLFPKAEIRLPHAEIYSIRQVGVFNTSVSVTKNENEIANLKMNWKGQIVISFNDGPEFLLKAKGMFHNTYVIENKDEESFIQLDPKFNWSKFDYNYNITCSKSSKDILLVLLGVYAANYYVASMSGMV